MPRFRFQGSPDVSRFANLHRHAVLISTRGQLLLCRWPQLGPSSPKLGKPLSLLALHTELLGRRYPAVAAPKPEEIVVCSVDFLEGVMQLKGK